MTQSPEITRGRAALRAYYDQWRSLTEGEYEAIAAGNWHQVDQLQESKRQLQVFITGVTRELRSACEIAGVNADDVEQEFRKTVVELIRLESRNNQTVATLMQHAQAEKAELETAARTLHQVGRAYTPARESNWHSYS